MSTIRQIFSDPRRHRDIAPLVLPTFPISGSAGLKNEVRGLISMGPEIWFEASKECIQKIEEAGNPAEFLRVVPDQNQPPNTKLSVSLKNGFHLNPVRVRFKDGVLGYELSKDSKTLGRVSFDLSYDNNPHYNGAEMYRAVSPRLWGIGLGGRLGDFAEDFCTQLGCGYLVSFPSHPATCADVISRGYLPLSEKTASQTGKALFSSDGQVSFNAEHAVVDRLVKLKQIVDAKTDAGERRDFYSDFLTKHLFEKRLVGGRPDHRQKYYFMKKLRDTPIVGGLDGDVLMGRKLPWMDYVQEVARKKTRLGRSDQILPQQEVRDIMRERLLSR